MKVTLWSLVLCLAGTVNSWGKEGAARYYSPGTVRGVISDTNEWRVAGATINFKGAGSVHSTRTNADGEYQIELPPGVYSVGVSKDGYFQMRRADVQLLPADSVEINITIFLDTPEKVIRRGKVIGLRPPFKIDSFNIQGSNGHLPLLILGGHSSQGRIERQYKGVRLADGTVSPVIVSYNHLTVRAEEISFNIHSIRLKAIGNVLVEDGKKSRRYKSVELIFKSGKAVITDNTSVD